MSHIATSPHNPFNLTLKQQLFIAHLVTTIRTGKPIKPKESIKAVYHVKNDTTARSMASEYLAKPNIQQSLQHELKKVGLMGNDSKVEQRLTEGLDAVTSNGMVDYMVRLHYIQEIHKIVGMDDANS